MDTNETRIADVLAAYGPISVGVSAGLLQFYHRGYASLRPAQGLGAQQCVVPEVPTRNPQPKPDKPTPHNAEPYIVLMQDS